MHLPLGTWLALVAVLWAGSAVFVALGLLLGLALEQKAAGGAMGIVGTVLALLGGLWVPAELFPGGLQAVAHALPSYWYAEIGRDVAAGEAPSAVAVAAPRRLRRRRRGARGHGRPAPADVRGRGLSRRPWPTR